MAANLQLLKRRIKTAKNISQIAKAMEMISASKIKRAQTAVENNKPYAKRITELTIRLINNLGDTKFSHPFFDNKTQSSKKLLIAISPDRGLCGSLNTNIMKKLMESDPKNTVLVSFGDKIARFAGKTGFELLASFPMGTSLPSYAKIIDMIRLIEDMYGNGTVSEVGLLFTEFNSFFAQTPVIMPLLPIKNLHTDGTGKGENSEYLFEPNPETLLESLLPHYVEVKLYSALIEAYTSEQAARMIAMQNAKNNARDIAEYLTLAYNKSRQERITNEILDIINSAQI